MDKAKQIWQFYSINGRKNILQTSEIDELYDNNGYILEDILDTIANKDFDELSNTYVSLLDMIVPYEYPMLSKQSDFKQFHNLNS